jgi:ABC-type lipoprotein export system ATPase subunit
MRRLNQENNQTFVLVTHSEEIGRQTDRIVWMRDGLIEVREEPLVLPAGRHTNGNLNGRRIDEPALQIAVEPII